MKQKKKEKKEQHHQDDNEHYDTVAKIKLLTSGFNTRMIMANLTPHMEMRTKSIYSFTSEIH